MELVFTQSWRNLLDFTAIKGKRQRTVFENVRQILRFDLCEITGDLGATAEDRFIDTRRRNNNTIEDNGNLVLW